ncbi:fungal specific transcription factor domain-containing protein [Aspergillus homomorphus CBS 101889]|uniref:Transcription factor domain-containing protein n=1 Tax=Aspergillus homomorphus (strain CBS 101889) TaxID=1450537 RepID=A0A395I9D4_ASPHC|nr:hypothetical protein BO97DRAFT_467364 [Aspergillus homomorphus CBS 101889]RAL16777.1 hypothetical protein BO97DRAFT_467364 [Aspergillus homomorphus CBS 101889]
MRCTRKESSTNSPCDRCVRNQRACVIPPARPLGRKPGAVGRFSGIEKAYRQIQAELRKGPGSTSLPKATISPVPQPSVSTSHEALSQHSLQPVSNPLALLADASEPLHTSESQPSKELTEPGRGRDLLSRPGYVSLGLHLSRETLETGLDTLFASTSKTGRNVDYFKQPSPTAFRDVGPDLDPVDLGLVTMEEAHALFPIYFARLHPVNGILDPLLHTPEFVRSQSALLFTWILALTAQFDRTHSSLARRLQLHGEKLSRHVHTCGLKSVEIVQGYYISLLSATPAKSLAEERTWLYTMYAFGTAAELGLDQHSRPFGQLMDSTESTYRQRLIRNKERTWFRILLWERANSAARGRINPFPDTELIANIEAWWKHPLADATDKHTCAFILLRRHLASIHADLRTQRKATPDDPHWVKRLVDDALEMWCIEWLPVPYSAAEPSEQLATIFLYYVYLHNRLWILSFALQASQSGNRHIETIRQDCLQAAIHTCEVAVRDLRMVGEPLYCMLAPTWAMISYAAVLALKLFPLVYGILPGRDTELLALLSQVALQLERAGTTPSHRFGIAALLGEHLLGIHEPVKGLHPRHTSGYPTPSPVVSNTPANNLQDPVYDSLLTDTTIAMGSDLTGDSFSDLFREIFGPGFADFF